MSLSRVFTTPICLSRQLAVKYLTRLWRPYTVSTTQDLRAQLMNEVRTAMKNKDLVSSTTLRSVLSEVYSADKIANSKVSSSKIVAILRKAISQRQEAAAEFMQASRKDLAEKEIQESTVLSRLLPPLLGEAQIDSILCEIIKGLTLDTNPEKSLGRVLKEFYLKVEKSKVDLALVKRRADALLAGRNT